jgi:hypothetical protein
MPHAYKTPHPQATQHQARHTSTPVNDDTLMATFLQAVNAMQTTSDQFKHDPLGSVIDSIHKMTQTSGSFTSTLHEFMETPTGHTYPSQYQSTSHQSQYEEPWMASMPQVPRHTPFVESQANPQPNKPKPPISVYVPAGGNLEARFQNLKK